MTGYPDPSIDGPLDRTTALALIARADELLDEGELEEALRHFQRVVGQADPSVTAAALLGIGTVYFRADREDLAIEAWRSVLRLPESEGTYLAWRQLAGAFVRSDRLPEALEAYREADRRAPAEDRPEIAARLGWLTKELGDVRRARGYFERSRSAARSRPPLTVAIIAVTTAVSLLASIPDWSFLFDLLQLDKGAVAAGEYWRLISCTLLHSPVWANPLHLMFNMYALYFGGGLVERMYGARTFLAMYVLTGIAASTASFAFGGDVPSVGASGAVFGMFGVLVATSRFHRPLVDRESQAILRQVGILVGINLVLGFVLPRVDYFAHIGGLVAGLWLGVLLVPGRVRTLSPLASRADGGVGPLIGPGALGALAVLVVAAAVVAGLVYGTAIRG